MDIQVTGQKSRVYRGEISLRNYVSREGYPYWLGVFASIELLVETAKEFLKQFLEAYPEWSEVLDLPENGKIICRAEDKREDGKVFVEVKATWIEVIESAEQVQVKIPQGTVGSRR